MTSGLGGSLTPVEKAVLKKSLQENGAFQFPALVLSDRDTMLQDIIADVEAMPPLAAMEEKPRKRLLCFIEYRNSQRHAARKSQVWCAGAGASRGGGVDFKTRI